MTSPLTEATTAITKFRSGGVVTFVHADATPSDFFHMIELLLFEANQCSSKKSVSAPAVPQPPAS